MRARIRQIKPEFWTDETIERLSSDSVRLFYIGTWTLADDEGYFRATVREIGHALLGYQEVKARERKVVAYLAELEAAGRLRRLECGHIVVVRLRDHQSVSSTKRVRTAYAEHVDKCPSPGLPGWPRGGPGDDQATPAGRVRDGTERDVTREAGGDVLHRVVHIGDRRSVS